MYYLIGGHIDKIIFNMQEKIKHSEGFPYILQIKVYCQWRSQNAEKDTHTKGRLLDQAMILFNCVPFQNGNFS